MALQGPLAAASLAPLCDGCESMAFMTMVEASVGGAPALISRSGYTGEDGFEISVAASDAVSVAQQLLDLAQVAPIGLGARDSLRLEAGLCLYGHDIDETTTPIEAALTWSVGRERRDGTGYPGADTIARQIAEKPTRRRVGLQPEGRQPAREGASIVVDGTEVGTVTSGGFSPTLQRPIAMGYVALPHAKADTQVDLIVRGRSLAATVTKMPFVPHRYYRAA